MLTLKELETLSRETTWSELYRLPSEKGSTLKGKNFLPWGANSFLLEQTPSEEGLPLQESKQDLTVLVLNNTSTLVGHFVLSKANRKSQTARL